MKKLLSTSLIVAMTAVVGGCATSNHIGETSQFSPSLNSHENVNSYHQLIKGINKQVVRDNLGTYYHEIEGDGFYKVFLNIEDADALKNVMSSGVGMLEPVFTVNSIGETKIDWNATEKRHRFFTEKVKLKLLPMSATREFHDIALKYSKEKAKKGMNVTSMVEAFSGQGGLYDKYFKDEVLPKMKIKPDYFIQDTFGGDFYGKAMSGYNPSIIDQNELLYHNANSIILFKTSQISITPTAYYENLEKPGFGRYNSGCMYILPETYHYIISENKRNNNIPYLSSITSHSEDNKNMQDARIMSQKSQELQTYIKELPSMRTKQEQACLYGLRQLAVSGVIESQTLD